MTLHGVSSLPAGLEAKNVEVERDCVTFLYGGEIKELLRTAESLPIYDMTISEPDLDEIFLHYYEKEDAGK